MLLRVSYLLLLTSLFFCCLAAAQYDPAKCRECGMVGQPEWRFCPACGTALGPRIITSHLGNQGPAFEPGMTPALLRWGPDDRPYPDRIVINPADGAEMVWVPAGEFMMGSDDPEIDYAWNWAKRLQGEDVQRSLFEDEKPRHGVRISRGFWIYRHEVTNAQLRRFKPHHRSGSYLGVSLDGDRHPAVRVSWEEAKAYCDWAGVRLPTEAEWEYACRARSTSRFWWGDSETEAGKYANVSDRSMAALWARSGLRTEVDGVAVERPVFETDDGHCLTAPVGSFVRNGFGLHDAIGNVWEWCADWYDERYYANSPATDPPGPATGTRRVLRGGAWSNTPASCRSANRSGRNPGYRVNDLGFRPCRNP